MKNNLETTNTPPESQLYQDVCHLIENTRQRLAATVNAEACIMHWQIGKRIKEDVLYNKRADYGKQIVKNLAKKLTEKYGSGWSDRKLLHCIRAAYTFSEDEIVYAVRTQLTWTHLRSIMFIEDELIRSFYFEMCRLEHWDTRTLNKKIDSQLYFNKNERMEGEESPIGLILCSEGNTEHIEYLMLDDNNIRVAQYYTQLPDKKLLSEKLQRAIAIAKENFSNSNKKQSE